MSTPLRTYFNGRNGPVSMIDHRNNEKRYYHYDHQGTVQCLTDETGAVTDRFASDAWGVEVKRTGATINRQWCIGRLGYYRQMDQTLDYVRARCFNSQTGRWLGPDPSLSVYPSVGQWLEWDPIEGALYAYVGNSPVNRVDPSGLSGSISDCDKGKCPKVPFLEVPNLPVGHNERCALIKKQYNSVQKKCKIEFQSGKPDYDIHRPEATTSCHLCFSKRPTAGYCNWVGPGDKWLYCEGCISLFDHFFKLDIPYQMCVLEHEQRRVACCTANVNYREGCPPTGVGPRVSPETEVNRMLDCIGNVLRACGLKPGWCRRAKNYPPFNPNSCSM